MRHIKYLLFVLVILLSSTSCMKEQWEYKVLYYETHDERIGYDISKNRQAFKSTPILPKEEELNLLGKKGWELVSVYTQYETAFPNFGNLDYVTGINPNIRPKVVVFIFKRKKWGFSP